LGAQNYDFLSKLGHGQAVALGQRLAALEIVPTGFVTGDRRRQCDTMVGLQTGMGLTAVAPQVHLGLSQNPVTRRFDEQPQKPFSQPGRHCAGLATRRVR